VIAVLLVVVGSAGRPDHDQEHCYHHAPEIQLEAATASVELLMMDVSTSETCLAVNKRLDNKLQKLLHLVGWFIWIVWWCTDLRTLKKYHINSYGFSIPHGSLNVVRSKFRTVHLNCKTFSVRCMAGRKCFKSQWKYFQFCNSLVRLK
jgi:hypothetical protein